MSEWLFVHGRQCFSMFGSYKERVKEKNERMKNEKKEKERKGERERERVFKML